ncbi:hypothetical protein FRX31_019881, partial [Thalictrum thalictroides]
MTYPNPDANFSEAPMMLTIVVNGTKRDIVAAAEKSGYAWVERDNEPTVFLQLVGPGVLQEGVAGELPQMELSDSEGALFAMDVDTGKILWAYNTGVAIYGGVSVSDGCVYVGNGYKVSLGA